MASWLPGPTFSVPGKRVSWTLLLALLWTAATVAVDAIDPSCTIQHSSANDELFNEWLDLAGNPLQETIKEDKLAKLTKDDAVIIVDMQKDFVLKSVGNPDGGRFGVPGGELIIDPICRLIRAAADAGATVVATRDYHPFNHCSFSSSGDGKFPAHCVQGTKGSEFLPEIATALKQAMQGPNKDKVHIVFKGFHEDVDSFGALPYAEAPFGDGRITKAQRASTNADFAKFGVCTGCSQAPWTGSLVLQQSAVEAARLDSTVLLDANAPPDVLSVLPDGVDRKRQTLQDVLQNTQGRVIACGLALDFCVLDTCRNARALGFADVAMCVDAARAAHVHGVGTHGSGFVQDPAWVASELSNSGIEAVTVRQLLGGSEEECEAPHAGSAMLKFPHTLSALGLSDAAGLHISLQLSTAGTTGTYALGLVGPLEPLARVAGFDNAGVVSPATPLPPDWPGASEDATHLCWAYPMTGLSEGKVPAEARTAFLSISTCPELRFAAHGGFVLLDANMKVVQAQAVGAPDSDNAELALQFSKPRGWREDFTSELESDRFQKITLPELKARGAESFCWLGPHEELTNQQEKWVPSSTGAFLYLRAGGEAPVYFPRDIPQPEP